MPFDRGRGHVALRRGRFSQPQATYFLTLCTVDRKTGLNAPPVASSIRHEIDSMTADHTWRMRCMVIMPDHVHVVARLGNRLSLGQTIQRLKAKTSLALKTGGLAWARAFFDRKLRPDDALGPIFLYVHLNPYRAGLLARTERWPHFSCDPEDWEWFRPQLDHDIPPPEWLA